MPKGPLGGVQIRELPKNGFRNTQTVALLTRPFLSLIGWALENGVGEHVMRFWGGNVHKARPPKPVLEVSDFQNVGLVWLVPICCTQHERASPHGRGKRIIGGEGPRTFFGKGLIVRAHLP